jgi:hypothetical protein
MFGISQDYRERAKQMLSDADELESGRSKRGNVGGDDESASWAATLRDKAAKLLRLSSAYERD